MSETKASVSEQWVGLRGHFHRYLSDMNIAISAKGIYVSTAVEPHTPIPYPGIDRTQRRTQSRRVQRRMHQLPRGPLPHPEDCRPIGQASTPQPRLRRDAGGLRDLSSRRQMPRCALESGVGIESEPEPCDVHTAAYVECDPERDGIARDAAGTI